MAKINTKPRSVFTHEGAKASRLSPLETLKRSVSTCLLWERTFYEDGEDIADRITRLASICRPQDVAFLASYARNQLRLRHAPLMLAVALARIGYKGTADVLYNIIQRPDELTEFLALYWKDGKQSLSAQVKKGLARAFTKFDAYQLAKYNRDGAIKLRDVLFLCHAKPLNDEQAETWKQLVDGTLPSPDTWEVALSAGEDKRDTFMRLISQKKLGYMALLRNLRNMHEAGVPYKMVDEALVKGADHSKALPYRFVSALRAAPKFIKPLERAMLKALKNQEPLDGDTVICVDVSGSMGVPLSNRPGDWNTRVNAPQRVDAASSLALLLNSICPQTRVIGFGTHAKEVPAYQGLALVDKLAGFGQVVGHGTNIGAAVKLANQLGYDRLIVITDEQSHDDVAAPLPGTKAYIINVAPYEYGVGYGQFTHINGFSEAVVDYIRETE